jgi:4-amino-4-deoxy-L-arabinose transferase-like glycosyltransferase
VTTDPDPNLAPPGALPAALPPGYREGFLTAITVLLGFSLAFVRFWGFEIPGPWTVFDVLSALIVGIGTAIQLFALFRSLKLADDRPAHYRVTVRYFLAGVLLVLVGIFVAIVSAAGPSPAP